MEVKFLFDSKGEYIAFRLGQYIFDTGINWIGWLPWEDGEVVSVDGEYIGTIWSENRLYYFSRRKFKMHPGYPGFPGHVGYPGYPTYPGCASIPPFARDLFPEELNRDETDSDFDCD